MARTLSMEEILAQLLVPDNDTIGQATKSLREAFQNQEAVPRLCNVLTSCTSSQIRQYAAVLLRKHVSKLKNWNRINIETRNTVKQGVLPLIHSESEKTVKSAIVHFIAAIAKHELSAGTWPELSQFLEKLLTSGQPGDKELCMFTMSILTDVALDVFSSNPSQFVFLFSNSYEALDQLPSVLGYYTVLTMTRVVPIVSRHPELQEVYLKAVPKILAAVPGLAVSDEEKACDVLDFFEELLQSAPTIISPHMSPFIQLCLHITANKELGDSVRERAMSLISSAVQERKKLIVKLQLVQPIIGVLFTVMCEPPADDEEGEEEDWFADEENYPFQCATNTIKVIAVCLPPNKVVETVLEHVSANLTAENKYQRKACYLALAVVTEGASECIRNKYLKTFLQCVCGGITENSPTVRNAALFALGLMSEHLQPEISEHADELMPILMQYLAQLSQRLSHNAPEPPGLYSMFYALETFCENLEDKLVPYLPNLLEHLLSALQRQHPITVQELAISAVGSVSIAVNAGILPFFPSIIDKLKMYLIEEHTEESACLQAQALQTLSLIMRTLGKEHCLSIAGETMALGSKLLQGCEDPDIIGALFNLFGTLATILEEESATFLPALVETAMRTLCSTEGIVSHSKDDGDNFTAYEDLFDPNEEEDITQSEGEEEEDEEITVENAYMNAKEEACCMLRDFAEHTGSGFSPFLENCFEEIFTLTSHLHDELRKASFEVLPQFCINFKNNPQTSNEGLQKALGVFVPQCLSTATKETDYIVVNAAVEALAVLLKQVGPPVLSVPGTLEQIVKLVSDILTSKICCQDREEEEPNEEADDDEAEQDELLMETAGEVIPALGQAMPPEHFVTTLHQLLPYVLPKLGKQSSVSMRSFFIGCLAESMAAAAPQLQIRPELSNQLLSLYLPLTRDSHHEVRNNAMFGLGELVLHSKESLFPKYMEILCLLSESLANESHRGVIDNICGATARLISTNADIVPVNEVLPVLLNKLPLEEDLDEHEAVLKCLMHLYQRGDATLKNQLAAVIRIACLILHSGKSPKDSLTMAGQLLQRCYADFPQEAATAVQSLPPEIAAQATNFLNTQS